MGTFGADVICECTPKDPLFRFFDREVKLGATILRTVRADLRELQEICSGEKRQGCNSIDQFFDPSHNLSFETREHV